MNKKAKILFIISVIIVVIASIVFGWNKYQEMMFFHPWNDNESYKKLQEIDEFEEIEIKNSKVHLYGWFWDIQKSEKAPLVIFFTGNAQNSSNTLYTYYQAGTIKDAFSGYNLMIVDYPGYGMSKGKPSDKSMFTAASYVFDYATKMSKVDKDNIIIMGYSIGTGVATYCGSIFDAKALILVAPYDKALSLYNDDIDIFHGALESLTKYKFDSATYAESVIEPTLIITSKDDEVIDYRHSLDLSAHFSELEEIHVLDGVAHSDYFFDTSVLEIITEFLNKNM